MKTTSIQNFYHRFPMLQPYVGEEFGREGAHSLLLVGESHYLPNGSTVHRDAAAWYEGHAEQLNEEERGWISTSDIIREGLHNRFSNKAFSIWKNALWEINDFGFCYDDYLQAGANVAAYNFFLRPAEEGCSLDIAPEDVRMANEALAFHCDQLRPSGIIILSRLAAHHIEALPDIPSVVTPHPGCVWWNRRSNCYGGNRGRDLLAGFVAGMDWGTQADHAN